MNTNSSNSVLPLLMIAVMTLSSNAYADFYWSYEGYRVFNTYYFVCHGVDVKENGPLAARLDKSPTEFKSYQ